MAAVLLLLYVGFCGVGIVLAALVALQTWEHRRFARSRLAHLDEHPQEGPALVVAPCRGMDEGLEENLRSLFGQDYQHYQIRFVVESLDDPAYPVILRLMAAHPHVPACVIVAGRASQCGQKVHNLRAATADVPPHVRYLAFVDSDARVRRQWLRALLEGLEDPKVGAVTGYRWFVPGRASLGNHLVYSINASSAVFFGLHSPTVVWGGSWAMRRELFEALGLRQAWQGTLSDDLVASRLLRQAGLCVLFEPACMVLSPLDGTLRELSRFVRRQYLMGRLYLRPWWALALLLTTLASLPHIASLGVLVWCLASGSAWGWLAAGLSGLLYGFSALGGWFRQGFVRVYFPQLDAALRGARRFEIWAGPLVALANWLHLFGSTFGRHVTWRGIRYRLAPDGQVLEIQRPGEPPSGAAALPAEDQPLDQGPGPALLRFPSDWARAA